MTARLICPHCGKAVTLETTTTQTLKAAPLATCAHCGDEFLPERMGQVYCSPRCRVAAKKAEAECQS